MKNSYLIFSMLIVFIIGNLAFTQDKLILTEAEFMIRTKLLPIDTNETVMRKNYNIINCSLEIDDKIISGENKNNKDSIIKVITNVGNWKLINLEDKNMSGFRVVCSVEDIKRPTIYINFQPKKGYKISFLNQNPIEIDFDPQIFNAINSWGFGKGKAVELAVRRIAEQKAIYAFDYNTTLKVIEYRLSSVYGKCVSSVSLNIDSKGIIGSDEETKNGTKANFGGSLNNIYDLGGLDYCINFQISYLLETKSDSSRINLFEITNKSLSLGLKADVPFTTYPNRFLTKLSHYTRLSMPLILEVNYLLKGKDNSSNETSSRTEFIAKYELAFSPFLILKGECGRTFFFNSLPSCIGKAENYYTFSIAQDLNVVKKLIPILDNIIGVDIEGKNFVFFKITGGKQPPAFQNINEKSIGFGIYF